MEIKNWFEAELPKWEQSNKFYPHPEIPHFGCDENGIIQFKEYPLGKGKGLPRITCIGSKKNTRNCFTGDSIRIACTYDQLFAPIARKKARIVAECYMGKSAGTISAWYFRNWNHLDFREGNLYCPEYSGKEAGRFYTQRMAFLKRTVSEAILRMSKLFEVCPENEYMVQKWSQWLDLPCDLNIALMAELRRRWKNETLN